MLSAYCLPPIGKIHPFTSGVNHIIRSSDVFYPSDKFLKGELVISSNDLNYGKT